MADPINILSLCSGVGWLDEGVRLGLEYLGQRSRVLGYVERDAYAAACLLARMEESSLEPAPIWCGNLQDVDFRGLGDGVDLLCAGFPCQPWSSAGKQVGTDDDRWLWPAIAKIIAQVQPGLVFLENVPGLVSGGGLNHVLDDLALLGFDAEWTDREGAEVGASHERRRVFILAYPQCPNSRPGILKGSSSGLGGNRSTVGRDALADGDGTGRRVDSGRGVLDGEWPAFGHDVDGCDSHLADTGSERRSSDIRRARSGRESKPAPDGGQLAYPQRAPGSAEQLDDAGGRPEGAAIDGPVSGQHRDELADAGKPRLPESERGELSGTGRRDERRAATEFRGAPLFAPGPGDFDGWGRVVSDGSFDFQAPAVKPGVRVLVNGVSLVVDASRADQLRCSGNGVVALQAAVAFVELVQRIRKGN